jgi:hypothetical protein
MNERVKHFSLFFPLSFPDTTTYSALEFLISTLLAILALKPLNHRRRVAHIGIIVNSTGINVDG